MKRFPLGPQRKLHGGKPRLHKGNAQLGQAGRADHRLALDPIDFFSAGEARHKTKNRSVTLNRRYGCSASAGNSVRVPTDSGYSARRRQYCPARNRSAVNAGTRMG